MITNVITDVQIKQLEYEVQLILESVIEDAANKCNNIDDLFDYNCQVTTNMILLILNACNITEIEFPIRKDINSVDISNFINGI